MTVYAVVATDEQESMDNAVSHQFSPQQFLKVGDGLWLIDSECSTTKDLTLLLSGGEENTADISSFIILPVHSYYGMHTKLVWEWLSAKGL